MKNVNPLCQKKQNTDLKDVDWSFEESSASSNETDSEHKEQLRMSLRSLPGNLMSSQQGHFEQVAQSTKNYPDSVEAIRALQTLLGTKHFIRTKKQRDDERHRLSLEISKKLQSTGKLSLSLKHFIYMHLDYSYLCFLTLSMPQQLLPL